MATITQYWEQLQARARAGLMVGVVLVLALTAGLAYWAMRGEHKVLFADMTPQDAATMVAELERLKVPYRLENEGNTILVPAEIVHNTRLKLVGRDLPLQGTVGLELFNNADLGMTEFAQKVNHQRAQQGELTRTILSIDGVQSVRVHLALPEQGLFKKSAAPVKASIALTMKPGAVLRQDRVTGIQRLVAAAVANLKAADVTVLDQHGVALSAAAGADGEEADPGPGALDGKRGLEEYLNRKLVDVLDKTFGVGQSIASVDVVVNQDRVKTTTESVLPGAPAEAGSVPSGVVVRERTSTRPASGQAGAAGQPAGADVESSEIDYQVGRRVEQVVHGRGALSRLNVAVLVKKPLDAEQIERVKDIVALAVGFNKERGDGIAVYSTSQLADPAVAAAAVDARLAVPVTAVPVGPTASAVVPRKFTTLQIGALLLAVILLTAALIYFKARREARLALATPRLSEQERHRLLLQMREWMDAQQTAATERQP